MKGNTLKSLSGFAIIIDLRNFSEICRRLLIQEGKPLSNRVKWQIYTLIFDFLSETLEIIGERNSDVLFDYKHTGDGFLFLTRHFRNRTPHSVDSFLLLLDLYLYLDETIQELNVNIIDLLKKRSKIIRGNSNLRYIRNLFRNESGTKWRRFIASSIGAHCGTIFYKTHGDKKLFLGNTINQASRFQALSNTFSDYNLFFSEAISNRLKRDVDNPDLYSGISKKWIENLERVEIKGIGPSAVRAIHKRHINDVREALQSIVKNRDS